ncbi:MAG TPA: hypothetical protein VFA11_02140 [Acidimicrobiales bacterium]|nr:hypothetical protein [Acidimicrobiales bacterium]
MINPILRRAAAGIAVCLVAGACGATGGVVRTLSAVPTKAQVNSAFHAVGGLSGVDITLQIDATAAQLQRMDPTTNARDAALLSHSALNMLVVNAGGGTLSDLKDHPSDLRFELTADVGAGPLVDLVEAHHTLYGRADVNQIMSLAKVTDPQAELTKIESQIPPVPALGFVKDLLAGQWVSLDLNQLKGLASDPQIKQMLSGLGTTGMSQPSPSTLSRVRSAITSAFDRDLTVRHTGTDPQLGDRFVVSAPARQLVTDLAGSVSGLLPQMFQAPVSKVGSQVPDRTVSAEVFVKSGVLRALRLDVTQFDSKLAAAAGGPVYLELDVTPTTQVPDGPAQSTPIDLQGVLSAVFGDLGSANGGTPFGGHVPSGHLSVGSGLAGTVQNLTPANG